VERKTVPNVSVPVFCAHTQIVRAVHRGRRPRARAQEKRKPSRLERSDTPGSINLSSPKPHSSNLAAAELVGFPAVAAALLPHGSLDDQVRRVLSLADTQTGRYRRLYSR